MFNRYWREYPWYFQLFQYIIFIFVFASLFGGVLAPLLVPYVSGITGTLKIGANSTPAEVNAMLWWQAIGHFGMFTLPALVFAYLTHPQPWGYLGLRQPGKQQHWGYVAVMMVGAIPLVLGLGGLMRLFDLGEAANRMHAQTEAMMKKMMDVRSGGQLLWTIFVMAVLPAVGEELMFRGLLMRFAARRAKAILFPVAVSALMFALFHFSNPYALVPIFLMGVLLALIYYWTRSLLCSMLAHFLFNGTQIFLYYLSNRNTAVKAFVESESVPVGLVAGGAVLFAAGAWMLWRSRTPLPQPEWTADFSPEELAAREADREERMRM